MLLLHVAVLSAVTQIANSAPVVFDYVIVGAGPAGLVLANRLSSQPNITVAVIEAGDAQFENPNVTRVDTYGLGLGTQIDWGYNSAPQKYTSNRTLQLWAGKALGGTTTINGMTYLRAEKEQIDAWENFGNEGWNWDTLWQRYLRQERFQTPNNVQTVNGATFETDAHGFQGEITVGWSKYFNEQNLSGIYSATTRSLELPVNHDANNGRLRGYSVWPQTLNSTDNIRQDAARAYYYPVAFSRSNLHVYLNTTATRIVWKKCAPDNTKATAKGVEVLTPTNTTFIIEASAEVILSAGSIRSPALLELSGIGNPAVLSPLGVDTVIDLPTVGFGIEDQPNTAMYYTSPTNWTGYPTFVSYVTASDMFGPNLSTIAEEVYANISEYASAILADVAAGTITRNAIETRLRIQADLIFAPDSTVPLAELLLTAAPNILAAAFWDLLPFSRGEVHIESTDPTRYPRINSNYFQLPIDQYVQAAAAIKARQYFATAPLSNHSIAEVTPNFTAVPKEANLNWRDDHWGVWMKEVYGSNSHPVATCAMMSRELGGVVDGEGRVYGSENVRVVDASIIPTQISGHLSATVYAIAEMIAEKILDGRKGA